METENTGNPPVYFGDDFGQKIDLTVRIREILRNYPEGTSIFKEMVQNADDAGATEVTFCLDYRQHASARLAYKKLELFQGPSLLVYNNATFTDADFQSIQRIGDSLKKDNSKGWKTGRFGVGFNSVYHMTDLPAFVSGSHLVFFDPQASHLPNVNPSNPGKMINFMTHPDLITNFPDQITPFRCFGCDFSQEFQGTIFRLALRNETQAQCSRLSTRIQDPKHVAEMLGEFADDLPLVLLFLRNVSKISVMEWHENEASPQVVREAFISNLDNEIQVKRSLKQNQTMNRAFSLDGIICDYILEIRVRRSVEDMEEERKYLISNQLGGKNCSRIASEPANTSLRLVPWGGVAVEIPTAADSQLSQPTTGMAFCFLPLPTPTCLPVHVNGYFELSSNRRDIWFGEGLSGEGLLRAQWNNALLSDVIAPCYARAIMQLTNSDIVQAKDHVQFLPQSLPPAPWNILALSFFELIRDERCLFSEAECGIWVTPMQSLMIRRDHPNCNDLAQWLLNDNFPVVRNLTEDLERVLVKTKTIPRYLEPSMVRHVYKSKVSVQASDRSAVAGILKFMLSDLKPEQLNEIDGVAFLPVANGTLHRFKRPSHVDMASLDYLCSMGFSRQHSMRALELMGGESVDTALNWLFQNPNPAIALSKDDERKTFFIPTKEELCLLEKARDYLVDIDAVPSEVLKLLSSDSARGQLNVNVLDYEGFEDLLSVVLPAHWYGKPIVPWDGQQEDEPKEEWFRQFWVYAGKCDQLNRFKDKWPIVPTSSGVLTSLSATSGVLSPELIPAGCLACLKHLRVRLLLPNLFASIQPHSDVWQYIQQPTPAGVLSCLGVILESSEDNALEVFKNANIQNRDDLLAFLMSGLMDDISNSQKSVCWNLPIFRGFTDSYQVDSSDLCWIDAESDDEMRSQSDYAPIFVTLQKIKEACQGPLMSMGIGWKFLDHSFVYVKEGDTLLWNFLLVMGVRGVSKLEFFSSHLVPRFHHVKSEDRVEFIYQLLLDVPMLLAQDANGTLSNILATARIFPTMSGELKPISDLYDPEIDEFAEIMDESFFPAAELQNVQPLSILRSIGLQRTLSRRSILSLALSLENDQARITNADEEMLEDMLAKLRRRSMKFFKYVDLHMEQLVTVTIAQKQEKVKKSMKTKGLKFLRTLMRDDNTTASARGETTVMSATEAEELEQQTLIRSEIEDFKAKLALIEWIPVCEEKPHPVAPWFRHDEKIVVASPQRSRPAKHLWLCSGQYHIIRGSINSDILRSVLGWNDLLPAETIAHQLKEIASNFEKVGGNEEMSDTDVIWSAVFNIYKVLSTFFEVERDGHKREQILNILGEGGKYVWIGNRFVFANQVAASALVNAEPYLFTVPNELLHFRPFLKAIGVEERFGLSDYVHVLGAMHNKYQEPLNSLGTLDHSSPLTSDELVTAIALIQLISDMLQHHSDYELFAPDIDGILVHATNLTFDDAPWLNNRDHKTSFGPLRFIHPKISNEVAAKIGAKSLRSQLLYANSPESMVFGSDNDVEAFGQIEALTKRISHILEQYPDGPNIISELIQNADDAGATRVCLLYNGCTYGTSSLLSASMAKWQGPALYCYNDSVFKGRDFINLARIGQQNKLQHAGTTGRFGLGFNSVYHFTDLPSIVSANSIVMFDPHATHLPDISAANPGIKVKFVNSNLIHQFPDQFAPFEGIFGCNLAQTFDGTLFRFPLRNEKLAEASEIKRRAYSQSKIIDLFESFKSSVTSTLLFLRNVRKVEVYIQSEIEQPPTLLFGAEVPAEDRGASWRQIDQFMHNNAHEASDSDTEMSAKKAFYLRLKNTCEDDLPSVTQVLHIRLFQRPGVQERLRELREDTDSLSVSFDENSDSEFDEIVEKYLVCNRLGGGNARDMACAVENQSLKLIPWVGIAGRIDEGTTEGRAFCFLPLPVRVGLPVHINGYFELSSNRRDIWHGDDMTGDAKLRSEWNTSLLSDAVAPAYLTFLLEAKRLCSRNTAKYLSFFPTKVPDTPWSIAVYELFRIMRDRPVFFASSSSDSTQRSVKPSSSVVVDETIPRWEVLENALLKVSLDSVHLPLGLGKLVVEQGAVRGAMEPTLFCQLTRGGRFLPKLEHEMVLRVVQFCLSGCNSTASYRMLDKLPILPLRDGLFGTLRVYAEDEDRNSHPTYYFGSAIEEELLERYPNRLLQAEYKPYFDTLGSIYEMSNIHVLNLGIIVKQFLPHIFSRQWKKSSNEIFLLESPVSETQQLSNHEWLHKMWQCVETHLVDNSQLPREFMNWPIVPVVCDEDAPGWVHLSSKNCLIIQDADTTISPELLHILQQLLCKIGIRVIDNSFVTGSRCIQWMLRNKFARKFTSNGLLESLNRYQLLHNGKSFEDVFAAVNDEEKQALCDFFSNNGWNVIIEKHQSTLRDLPIFPVYSPLLKRPKESETMQTGVVHVALARGGYLPAANADERVLDDSFYAIRSDKTRKFLRDCGVEEWSYTRVLLDHVFPRLSELEEHNSELVDSIVLDALISLAFHNRTDYRFRKFLQTKPIIPSQKRILRRVSDLHDPRIQELSELVGANSLPAEAFSSPDIVEILRPLGIRVALSYHAVLESARSIETMYTDGDSASVDQAWTKAHSLLTIVNKHFDKMMVNGDIDSESNDDTQSMQNVIHALKDIRWLPVLGTAIDTLMPWKSFESGSDMQLKKLATPMQTRPVKDAWFCSSSKHILDGELESNELMNAFGWAEPVEVSIVAAQVEAIGLQWVHLFKEQKRTASPPLQIRQMYEQLEAYQKESGDDWVSTSIYEMLSNAPWIWTGNAFAYPHQIAHIADAGLEPLLHRAPDERIIPHALLESFQLKETFAMTDYLTVLMKLPRRVVLDKAIVSACKKIYSIMAEDLKLLESSLMSFSSENIVILDRSNRLCPAIQLLIDDMEWNESSEARHGATFVNKDISKSVAIAFGAMSLHFKLAQTSVSSQHMMCPSANALESILPHNSEWYHGFYSEILLAAERFGGSQVDIFVDYRHHPTQRVIQPSLQDLQNEAICVHIHDLVLTENDINSLFRGESSRPGFLSGFFFSDCMQILSGGGFYILDPTESYLSSPTTPATSIEANSQRAANGIGRRYDILSQDFARYPDQLLPFTTLPSCPGNVAKGTESTLIRFPWRTMTSALSPYKLDGDKVKGLITYIKCLLHETLVFTESLHRVSIWSIGKDSEFSSQCHGEASLDNPDYTLRKRNITRQADWKKKFSFQSFFKTPDTPENQMEFVIILEIENRQFHDTWLISNNIGAGRSRDLACSSVHEELNSIPYVSVACHLLRNGNAAPRLRGRVFKIVDTCQYTGLPIHINGCFKKALKQKNLLLLTTSRRTSSNAANGSEEQIQAQWNRTLLEDGVVDAYMKLLLVAKRRIPSMHQKVLYNIWPTLQNKVKCLDKELGVLVQTQLYNTIGNQELFLCTDGSFRPLNSGYLIDLDSLDLQVASFAQLHFPAFDIPPRILADCIRLMPSCVHSLTPKAMRRFLRNSGITDLHSSVCVPLLEYCLSDVPFPIPSENHPIWSEFQGLPLLPLEDGSIGRIKVNHRSTYVLATFNQVEILAPMKHIFVSLAARQRLHAHFSDAKFISIMGLSVFSIKTLSDHIDRVLPMKWKNQSSVSWDPSNPDEIDQLWLYRFWQEVRYERRSLAYFNAWPLIPVKGSRLVSCGKPDTAICVWRESFDKSIAESVMREFQASNAWHDESIAEMETERKRLLQLTKTKLKKESSYDDENEELAEYTPGENIVEDSIEDKQDVKEDADDDEAAIEMETVSVNSPKILADETVADNETALDDNTETSDTISHAHDEETSPMDGGVQEISPTVEIIEVEYCSRETIHNILAGIGSGMLELAYFNGQEADIVPSSRDVAISVLDGICASIWDNIKWNDLSEPDAVMLAEFFSYHGESRGGYNRMHLDMLKKLPIYVNICGVACAVSEGTYYLIPPEINLAEIPLPPNARQCFLQLNPRLTGFYRDLGIEEMSEGKLLIYLLPMYSELPPDQCDIILRLIQRKWHTLRGDASLLRTLRTTALFRGEDKKYHTAHVYFDPRNKVLATMYEDSPELFPATNFQTSEWLDIMAEIGLRTEITVDVFIDCARRIEAKFSGKDALTSNDETLALTLHRFFIQNYEKFDRSRPFFDAIPKIAFVPAIIYENSESSNEGLGNNTASYRSRTVLRKYSDCATPDDQALVYSVKPILMSSALPPRILWSRLGLQSPPAKEHVLSHLFAITARNPGSSSTSSSWQFFLPMVDVFQEIFKNLQMHWTELSEMEQQRLADSAVIPVGSFMVKGSRLFFRLGENLAPLMFEVPRIFGAYDTLFRHMGAKDSPEVKDYVRLLEDLHDECQGNPLNLNELMAVSSIVKLLADVLAESNLSLPLAIRKSIYLPSGSSVMQSIMQVAYNDAPWLCSRINLTDLHVVHPRISTKCCQLLGVPGISAVVSEELAQDGVETLVSSDAIVHINSILGTQQFVNGVRKIITAQHQKVMANDTFGSLPDFEEINQRIIDLSSYEVKYVDTLKSRFVAKLDHPPRRVDVTNDAAALASISFLDQSRCIFYIAKRTLEANPGIRIAQVVASGINQLLGGILQDCSALESILTCDIMEIPSILQLLTIYEDPALIVEKLRGVVGEPLVNADRENIELSPLRSCAPGEIIAVEIDGMLRYGKVLQEVTNATGISNYEIKVSKSSIKRFLSTEIFSFRSSRLNSSATTATSSSASSSLMKLDTTFADAFSIRSEEDSLRIGLPASVVALKPSSAEIPLLKKQSSFSTTSAPVSASNIISAVNDLLGRLNMSLSTNYEELLASNMHLQHRLEQAEADRREASVQIDEAIREKKEIQDSLICAICLENEVNRVLIPCGHIYCNECIQRLPRPSCPICRETITSSSMFHAPS